MAGASVGTDEVSTKSGKTDEVSAKIDEVSAKIDEVSGEFVGLSDWQRACADHQHRKFPPDQGKFLQGVPSFPCFLRGNPGLCLRLGAPGRVTITPIAANAPICR